MELVYITHGNILNIHAITPLFSWGLVIGAGYGFVRLLIDATRRIRIAQAPLPLPQNPHTPNPGAFSPRNPDGNVRDSDIPTRES